MRAERKKPFKVIVLALAGLLLALLCHGAALPHQLLPVQMRYALYPAAGALEGTSVRAGDLLVFDKRPAELPPGAVVRRTPHPLSSALFLEDAQLGRLLEGGDPVAGYKVQVVRGGQASTVLSGPPERAVYRVAYLGGLVLFLNAHRYWVWGAVALLAAGYLAAALLLSHGRKLERRRQAHLALFSRCAEEFERESPDF